MEKKATSLSPLSQGEKLYLLVFRARKRKISTKKVALSLGLHPEYLPYLYKQPKLSMDVIKTASDFFNVHPSLFDDEPADTGAQNLVNELMIMRAELNDTRRALDAATTRLRALEEDRIIRDAHEIQKRRKRDKRDNPEKPDDTPNHN